MSGNNVKQDIISIIADVSGFELEEIDLQTHLANDLEIDSIKAIEITVAIEKKYKISIRDEDIPNIITVKDAVESASHLIAQKAES